MKSFNLVNEKIVLPISDIITGNKVSKYLKLVTKSQYWSPNSSMQY